MSRGGFRGGRGGDSGYRGGKFRTSAICVRTVLRLSSLGGGGRGGGRGGFGQRDFGPPDTVLGMSKSFLTLAFTKCSINMFRARDLCSCCRR